MTDYSPCDLSHAIAAIIPEVHTRAVATEREFTDRQTWWELSTCILSSQVPYDTAVTAANRIDEEKLLLENSLSRRSRRIRLQSALSRPLLIGSRKQRYRFAASRAAQLAGAYDVFTSSGSNVSSLLDRFDSGVEAREWLVANVPGLGPKQASMFLRNIGFSYDLAVIDRHVLLYMDALGMSVSKGKSIATLTGYRTHELVLRAHAKSFSCPIGFLDWAIWIVMRVARANPPGRQ